MKANSSSESSENEKPQTSERAIENTFQKKYTSSAAFSNYLKKSSKHESELKNLPPVPFLQLFRFTTSREKVTLFMGFVFALITGLVVPVFFSFLSELSATFINYNSNAKTKSLDFANNHLEAQVRKYCLIFVGLAVLTFITAYLQSSIFSALAQKQTLRIRETYYKSTIRQNMGWFDQVATGDLTTRISSDVAVVQDGLGVKLSYLIQYLAVFFGGFVLAFIRGYKMALVLIPIMPLLVIPGALMGVFVGRYTRLTQDQYAKSGAIANEVFAAMRTVMAFNGQKRELKRFSDNNEKASVFGRRKGIALGLGLGAIFFFIYTVYSLGFYYGAKLIRDGTYTPAQVLTIFFALLIGGFSLGGAAPSIAAVLSARGAAAGVFNLIDRISPIDPLDTKSGIMAENIKGKIELKNVTFSYPTRLEVPALRDFSIKINPGEKVAFVGESGSGKSTIIGLTQRFYDPQEGAVMVDGVDVKDYNVSSLRRNIAIVSQEPVLFDTSIYQNVAWGARDYDNSPPTNEEVVQACKDANIHEFISSLPDQYETLVGERGAQLSGGQKQRIAIARALIRNSPILLLDEATSALDTESERLVQEAIDNNISGCTTITVAHRLSTIKDSDRIYVCSKGSIIEQGSHQELIALRGAYFALVNAQELREVESNTFAVQKPTTAKDTKHSTTKEGESKPITVESEDAEVKINGFKALFTLLYRSRREIWAYLIGSIGAIADGVLLPLFSIFFSKILVALAISDSTEQKKKANFYALLILIFGILTYVAMFVRTYFFNYGSLKLSHKLRNDLFSSIVSQDSEYFDRKDNGTGAITSRLSTDPENVFKFGADSLPMLITSFTSILTGVIIALVRGWKLALIMLTVMPIVAFSEGQQAMVMTGAAKENQILIEAGAKEAAETISNIRTVASLTRERTLLKSFNANSVTPHKNAIKSAHIGAIAYGIAQGSIFIAYCLAFYAGSRFVINSSYTVEAVFNTIYANMFAGSALAQAAQYIAFIPKAVVASGRILRELNSVPKINISSEDGSSPAKKVGEVAAKNVEFTYPSRPDIKTLKSISLNASTGKTVALVGSSGSGKSTIVNLIMRLYDVEAGSVDVDRADVREWNLKELRGYPSLVGQEPVLFDYSISDNIKYGKPGATEYEVEQAAKAANIHSVLMNLPDGYKTRVGTNGGQLSGGQKQRVAIARAIISNPKVLLLDEATSALDTESEIIVQKALDEASTGITTITIAHRLSTIQNADWIYVFDRGEIAEEGTHESLTKKKGVYHSLAVQQSLTR